MLRVKDPKESGKQKIEGGGPHGIDGMASKIL